ncbi:Glycosyltransferase involved in cell wall bisynthesis [Pedobacter steynii]|uniref:Glycosyltransferase involved in cell wall bisynthesis n=1 Tax=Pedobacter steynii TaxID=430522 RepID=A0A1G9KKG5_9SPHI|nr:glycosyltransferase family 4 protein [Pedobacter steynii]NQX38577.1 glycosyltransferase family 4 protein [Pedobacter steynii]SDL50142.1 Glycosyltransferase involved in cell wall bisynthesis [Pedobacter steynii]
MNKSKMKILHAIRQGKIGGGETHVLDLVQELSKNDFESVVLAFTDGPLITELNKLGIKTHVILTEKPFDIGVWKEVRQLMIAEGIDLLHAHGTRAQSNTFWGARKLGIPVVYTVHGWSFHPNQNALVKKLRILSERFLVAKADVTICVSTNNLNEGRSNFPMNPAVVIKNGINFTKFNPDRSFGSLRAEFDIDEETLIVGYIARITAQKDPFTFIEAIAKVPDELNVKFLIVGDGDLKIQTVALAERLKVMHKVIFSGFRQDIPDLLSIFDIYCLPSLWEGLPIGLLEAMAMRKATISSAVNGTKEVIEDGVNGLLIEPKDAVGLRNAILRLVTEKPLRESLAKQAEIAVKKDYSISKMTLQIEDLYKKIKNR